MLYWSVAKENLRPSPMPQSAPPVIARLIEQLWHANPEARPSMEAVVQILTDELARGFPYEVGISKRSASGNWRLQ